MRAPSPSRLMRASLERFLRPSERDALGDLEEEFNERVRRSSSWTTAEGWYVAEGVSLFVGVLRERWAARREGPPPATTGRADERPLTGLVRDSRHAMRSLLQQPGLALLITMTLALSVGGTTAIFSLANAAFLRPLPYPGADRMVSVYTGSAEDPETVMAVSPLDLRDLTAFEAVVEASAAWSVGESVHLIGGEEPLRLVAPRATASLFPILGVEPIAGRFFVEDEEVPGSDDAVVLSRGLWERVYGADPDVIGRSIILDDRSHRVVGVAPSDGVFPPDADVWRPLALGPEWYEEGRWGWQFLRVVARLTPASTLDGATRALNERLAEATPDRVERLGQTRVLRSLYDERADTSGPALLVLLVAMAAVLAMACANIVGVMLVRSESRLREFGLRRALGSGAKSLARLVVVETLVLTCLGAIGGFVVADFGLRAVRRLELEALEPLGTVGIDFMVLAFGILLTLGVTSIVSAGPVLVAMKTRPHIILKEAGAGGGGTRRAKRLRDALVAFQVGAAFTLLSAVGLAAGAFERLTSLDPGFDPEGVLTVTIELPTGVSLDGAAAARYLDLFDGLSALPGVQSAGATNFLPLEGVGWSSSFGLIDPDPGVDDPDPGANMRAVSPDYMAAVGIPLLDGRGFTDADREGATPVALVDRSVAERFWPAGSPVRRQAYIGGLSRDPATIVGVVGDVPDETLGRNGSGHVYFPVLQSAQRRMTLVVKTDGDAAALAPAVRGVVRETDARIPITEVSTFQARLSGHLAGRRLGLVVLLLFGATAALLSGIGIYGVLAYTVARRTGEIGTRVALGAPPNAVFGAVVRHALRLWGLGAVGGVFGTVAAVEVASRYMDGIRFADPFVYLGALALMGLVALVGAALPARRALRVSPIQALRAR